MIGRDEPMRYPAFNRPKNECNKDRVHTYRFRTKFLILYAMSYPLVLYCKSGRDLFIFYLNFDNKKDHR